MTNEEKHQLNRFIAEKFFNLKTTVPNSEYVYQSANKVVCLADVYKLPDYFAPNGLQLVKNNLMEMTLENKILSFHISYGNQIIRDKEQGCYAGKIVTNPLGIHVAHADTEAEALLLAVKRMLESEPCR